MASHVNVWPHPISANLPAIGAAIAPPTPTSANHAMPLCDIPKVSAKCKGTTV